MVERNSQAHGIEGLIPALNRRITENNPADKELLKEVETLFRPLLSYTEGIHTAESLRRPTAGAEH